MQQSFSVLLQNTSPFLHARSGKLSEFYRGFAKNLKQHLQQLIAHFLLYSERAESCFLLCFPKPHIHLDTSHGFRSHNYVAVELLKVSSYAYNITEAQCFWLCCCRPYDNNRDTKVIGDAAHILKTKTTESLWLSPSLSPVPTLKNGWINLFFIFFSFILLICPDATSSYN